MSCFWYTLPVITNAYGGTLTTILFTFGAVASEWVHRGEIEVIAQRYPYFTGVYEDVVSFGSRPRSSGAVATQHNTKKTYALNIEWTCPGSNRTPLANLNMLSERDNQLHHVPYIIV